MRHLIHYLLSGLFLISSGSVSANDTGQIRPLGQGSIIEAAIENGRLVQAAEMLSEMRQNPAIAEGAESDILEAELAIAQRNEGRAMLLFAKYLQHPDYLCRAKEGTGIALARAADWNAAIGYLADVTAKCPDRWKAWDMMGVTLMHFGKFRASRHAFDTARSLSGNSPAVLNNLGYSLMVQRRYAEARDVLERALIQQSKNERIQNNLDIARAALGEAPEKIPGESKSRRAERLNNSGYAALLAGHSGTGTALLAEAVIGSSTLASQAAANLGWERANATAP